MTYPKLNSSSRGTMRLNTKMSQPRTSSNKSFQEQFRAGLKTSIDTTNDTFSHISRSVPGGAMLSSSLSDAASKLAGPSGLNESYDGVGMTDKFSTEPGEISEDQMLKKNSSLLAQQTRISQITTEYSTKSNMIKAMYETLRTIGSNIR